MGLRAVTLLGDNTVPILADVCGHVSGAGGIDVAAGAVPPDDADLIWGCGYLLCELIDEGRLTADIVAAPIFSGQSAAVYHSVIVAADPSIRTVGDARGRILAINEEVSWSGHHALVAHLAGLGMDRSVFRQVIETGSHVASVEAVAAGSADVASIDHTIWEHLTRSAPAPGGVGVIDRTRDWPAPPFAVHRRVPASLRERLVAALVGTPPRAVAGLAAIAPASRPDYAPLVPPPHHPFV